MLVLGLLGGTAAAFAVTEGLKLQRTPITSPDVTKVFSPVCDCPQKTASIAFSLRKADRVTLQIEDANGKIVRTLVHGRRVPHGRFAARWDGRDGAGRVAPQGSYEPRVHLATAHRTIVLPNPIRVDTTPPKITSAGFFPAVLSPDGDHRRDLLRVRYKVDEPAHALLFVNGVQLVRGRLPPRSGELRWYGRVGGHGVAAGRYRLTLRARDLAGNVSKPVRVGVLVVRYVTLAQRVVRVRAGTRFGIRALTDAPNVRWKLGRRTGVGRRKLVLRAPARPGRYHLLVQVNTHAARAVVIVEPKR
jgi:hypothetical protein